MADPQQHATFEERSELGETLMDMLDSINAKFATNRDFLLLSVAVAALAGALLLTQLEVHKLAKELACLTE